MMAVPSNIAGNDRDHFRLAETWIFVQFLERGIWGFLGHQLTRYCKLKPKNENHEVSNSAPCRNSCWPAGSVSASSFETLTCIRIRHRSSTDRIIIQITELQTLHSQPRLELHGKLPVAKEPYPPSAPSILSRRGRPNQEKAEQVPVTAQHDPNS